MKKKSLIKVFIALLIVDLVLNAVNLVANVYQDASINMLEGVQDSILENLL